MLTRTAFKFMIKMCDKKSNVNNLKNGTMIYSHSGNEFFILVHNNALD